MGKKEKNARVAKAEKSSFSKLNNKIRKKGKNKGMLPSSAKSQRKRVEQYGFDLTQAARPQLEKLPVRVLSVQVPYYYYQSRALAAGAARVVCCAGGGFARHVIRPGRRSAGQ